MIKETRPGVLTIARDPQGSVDKACTYATAVCPDGNAFAVKIWSGEELVKLGMVIEGHVIVYLGGYTEANIAARNHNGEPIDPNDIYYGPRLDIENWVKYVAHAPNGQWYYFQRKPKQDESSDTGWSVSGGKVRPCKWPQAKPKGDWKDSLHKVEHQPMRGWVHRIFTKVDRLLANEL